MATKKSKHRKILSLPGKKQFLRLHPLKQKLLVTQALPLHLEKRTINCLFLD